MTFEAGALLLLLFLVALSEVSGQPSAVVKDITVVEDDVLQSVTVLTDITDSNSCGTGEGTCRLEVTNIISDDGRYRSLISSVPPPITLSASTGCSRATPCSATMLLSLRKDQNTGTVSIPMIITFDVISYPSVGAGISASFQTELTVVAVNDPPESSANAGSSFTFSSYPNPLSGNPNVLEIENFATVVRVAPSTAPDEDGQILCSGGPCICDSTILSSGSSILATSPQLVLGSYTPKSTAPVSGNLELLLSRPIQGDFPRRVSISCSLTDNGVPSGVLQFTSVIIEVTGISFGAPGQINCIEDTSCVITNFIPSIDDSNGGATRFDPQNWLQLTTADPVRLSNVVSLNGFIPLHNPTSGCSGGCSSDLEVSLIQNRNTFRNGVNEPIVLQVTVVDDLGNAANPQTTQLSVTPVNDGPLFKMSSTILPHLMVNYSDSARPSFPEYTFDNVVNDILPGPEDEVLSGQSVTTSGQSSCSVSMPLFPSVDATLLFQQLPIIRITADDGDLHFILKPDLDNRMDLFSQSVDNNIIVEALCLLTDSEGATSTLDVIRILISPPNTPPYAGCIADSSCTLVVLEDALNFTIDNFIEASPRSLFGSGSAWELFDRPLFDGCSYNTQLISFFNITINQPVTPSSNYTASVELSLVPNAVSGDGNFSCTFSDSFGLQTILSGEVFVTSANDPPKFVFGLGTIVVDSSVTGTQRIANILTNVTTGVPPGGPTSEDGQTLCGGGSCQCNVANGGIFTAIPVIELSSNVPTTASPATADLVYELSGVVGVATLTCEVTDSEGGVSQTPVISISSVQQGIVWNSDRSLITCLEDVTPCVVTGFITDLKTVPPPVTTATYSSEITSTDPRYSQIVTLSVLQGSPLADIQIDLIANTNTANQVPIVLAVTIRDNFGNSFSRDINLQVQAVNDAPVFVNPITTVPVQLQEANVLLYTNTVLAQAITDIDGPEAEIQTWCDLRSGIDDILFFKENRTLAVRFNYTQLLDLYEQASRPGFPFNVDVTCSAVDAMGGKSTLGVTLAITRGKTAFVMDESVIVNEDQGLVVLQDFITNAVDNKLERKSATSPFNPSGNWYEMTSTDPRWDISNSGLFLSLPTLTLSPSGDSASLSFHVLLDQNTGSTPIPFTVTLTDSTGDKSLPVSGSLVVVAVNDPPIVGNKLEIERDGVNTSDIGMFLFGEEQRLSDFLKNISVGPETATDELSVDVIANVGQYSNCTSQSLSGRVAASASLFINSVGGGGGVTADLLFTINEISSGRYPLPSDLTFTCSVNDTLGSTVTVAIPVHIESGPPTWSPSTTPLTIFEDGSSTPIQGNSNITRVVVSGFIKDLNGGGQFGTDWQQITISNNTIISNATIINLQCDSGNQPLCSADLSLDLNRDQFGELNLTITIVAQDGLSHTEVLPVQVVSVNDLPVFDVVSQSSFYFKNIPYASHQIPQFVTSLSAGPDPLDYITSMSCVTSNIALFSIQPLLAFGQDNTTLTLSFTFSNLGLLSDTQLTASVQCRITDSHGASVFVGGGISIVVVDQQKEISWQSSVGEIICYEDGREVPVGEGTPPLPCFVPDFVRITNFNGLQFTDPEWYQISVTGDIISSVNVNRLPTSASPTADLSIELNNHTSGISWLNVNIRDRPSGRLSPTVAIKVTVITVNDYPIVMLNPKYTQGIPSTSDVLYQIDDFITLAVPGPPNEELTQYIYSDCVGVPGAFFTSKPLAVVANRSASLTFSISDSDVPEGVAISCTFFDANKTNPNTPMLEAKLGNIVLLPSLTFTVSQSVRCLEDVPCVVSDFVRDLRDRNGGLSEFEYPNMFQFSSTDTRFVDQDFIPSGLMYLAGALPPSYCDGGHNCKADLVIVPNPGVNTDTYDSSGVVNGADPLFINITIRDSIGRSTTKEFTLSITGSNDQPSIVQDVYEIVVEDPQLVQVFFQSKQIGSQVLPGGPTPGEFEQILCSGNPCPCQTTNSLIFANQQSPVLVLSDYNPSGLTGAVAILEYELDQTVMANVVGVQQSTVYCSISDSVSPTDSITVKIVISLVNSAEQVCGPIFITPQQKQPTSSACSNGTYLTSVSYPSCSLQCADGFAVQAPKIGQFNCPATSNSGIQCTANTCSVLPASLPDFNYSGCIGKQTSDWCEVDCPIQYRKKDDIRSTALSFQLQCDLLGNILNPLNFSGICTPQACPVTLGYGMIPDITCDDKFLQNDTSCPIECDSGFIKTDTVSPHFRHTMPSSTYCQVAPQSGDTTLFFNVNCTKSCLGYSCPSHMTAVPSMGTIACISGVCTSNTCCLEFCPSHDCTTQKMLPKGNIASIVCTDPLGCTDQECCLPTCASDFNADCGTGFTLRDNINQIQCELGTCTVSQCCVATCGNTGFTACGPASGFKLKSAPESIPCDGSNPQTDCLIDTCCIPTCCGDVEICLRESSSSKPLILSSDYESISCPSGKCSASDCCRISCVDYGCDLSQGLSIRDNPSLVGCDYDTGCTPSECCVARCQNVNCLPISDCHAPGTCDPTTGVCTEPIRDDGSICELNGFSGTCQSGRCISTSASIPCGSTTCTVADIGLTCSVTKCLDPANGVCTTEVLPVGTLCSDGSSSTENDVCTAATCFGYQQTVFDVCVALSDCHTSDLSNNICNQIPKPDLSVCNDQNPTTANDRCISGKCIGDKKCLGRVCEPIPCRIGSCNPETGSCSYNMTVSDNTQCGVTIDHVCIGGECVNRNCSCCGQLDGKSQNQCIEVTCDDGVCRQQIIRNGEACWPLERSYPLPAGGYFCQQGECRANFSMPVVEVSAPNHQCANYPDGHLCNDGNTDTFPDYCQNGLCTGIPFCTQQTCPIKECHALPSCLFSRIWDPITALLEPSNRFNTTVNDLISNNTIAPDYYYCDYIPVVDGTKCRSGVCLSGTCHQQLTCYDTTCIVTNSECRDTTCSDSIQRCVDRNVADYTPCSEGVCMLGECTPTSVISVTPCIVSECEKELSPGQCEIPTCTDTGCKSISIPDGSYCDDRNPLTRWDRCQFGLCIGQRMCLVSCNRVCRTNVVCDNFLGTCSSQPVSDGEPCVTTNSEQGFCQSGWCLPQRRCLVNGVFDDCVQVPCYSTSCCSEGCSYQATPNAVCDDNNNNTTNDQCVYSQQLDKYHCVGTNLCLNVICWPTESCQQQGLCDPTTGKCEPKITDDGTPCDDANPSTIRDRCYRGKCVGDDFCSTHCVSQSSCLKAVCNPWDPIESRRCFFVPRNGTYCDDQNPSTTNDTCIDGFCSGAITCSPTGRPLQTCRSTQCHTASCGTNGLCTLIPSSFNVQCNPNDAVSSIPHQRYFGTCLSGTCRSDNQTCDSVTCTAPTDCTIARCVGYRFNPSDRGSCEIINKNDYSPCHNNIDNEEGVCLFGICVTGPEVMVVTTPLVFEHKCTLNEICTDMNPFTVNDQCSNTGTCVGEITCNGMPCARQSQCHIPSCDLTGCIQNLAEDFTPCVDFNNNTVSSVCRSGVCVPRDRCEGITCPDLSDLICTEPSPFLINSTHVPFQQNLGRIIPGTCDPTTGYCVDLLQFTIPSEDGTKCNVTTLGGVLVGRCRGGNCVPEAIDNRTSVEQCPHQAIVCNVVSGLNCSEVTPVADGTPCNDYSLFTTEGTCQKGVCIGVDPCAGVTCSPISECHYPGTCIPPFGQCTTPLVPDYTGCGQTFVNPENTTLMNWCVSGSCEPAFNIDCPNCGELDPGVKECYISVPGECNPVTGRCGIRAVTENSNCDDSDSTTTGDICKYVISDVGDQLFVCLGSIPCDGQPCYSNNPCRRPYCSANVCTSIAVDNSERKPCDDQNPYTHRDICIDGQCTGEDICNPSDCVLGSQCKPLIGCILGSCAYQNKPDQTPCDDGNNSTARDQCRDGICVGVIATDPNEADCPITRSVCQSSPTAFECLEQPLPEQSPCDDGNPDTVNDICLLGVCVGVVYCPNECKTNSMCRKAVCMSGECTIINVPDDTPCVDYDDSTEYEVCRSGVCVGQPRCSDDLCTPLSQCHVHGACHLRICTTPLAPDGTVCDDGNPLTILDSCQDGVCVGQPRCPTNSLQCTQLPTSLQDCLTLVPSTNCSVNTTVCPTVALPDGDGCNDDNPHTSNDVCLSGICSGGVPCGSQVCSTQNMCQIPSCLSPNHCSSEPKPDGTPCWDFDDTTTNDICVSGTCQGTPQCSTDVVCPTRECFNSFCDPFTGHCHLQKLPDKTPCTDGNPSTFDDLCLSGICIGTPLCSNTTQCLVGVDKSHQKCIVSVQCNRDLGICEPTLAPNGTDCQNGICQNGVCIPTSDPLPCIDKCSDLNNLCIVNSCYGEMCTSRYAAIGSVCNDFNSSTVNDRCNIHGICSGTVPCQDMICYPPSQCHHRGTCNPITGMCSTPIKENGTPCNDLNPATVNDYCLNGVCVGTAQEDICDSSICNNGINIQCWEATGLCEPGSGVCEYAMMTDGVPCDDGNSKSQQDRCHSGTCVGTVPCGVNCESHSVCLLAVCEQTNGGQFSSCRLIPKPNGLPCTDLNRNTLNDTCIEGICVGQEIVCNTVQYSCNTTTTCFTSLGLINTTVINEPQNTPCNDNDISTSGSLCSHGLCIGFSKCELSNAKDRCGVKKQCSYTTPCDPTTGHCQEILLSDGVSCDDGDMLTINDICTNGMCAGELIKIDANDCSKCSSQSQCQTASCKGTACTQITVPDGRPCDDLNPLTINDVCIGGLCRGTDSCEATSCTSGLSNDLFSCFSETQVDCFQGQCYYTYSDIGSSCTDSLLVTQNDVCTPNGCGSVTDCGAESCFAPNPQCHYAVCLSSGNCLVLPKADGARCYIPTTIGRLSSFSLPLNQEMECRSGVCTPTSKCYGVNCSPLTQCHRSGVCLEATGECSNPTISGTPCDDGDNTTINDTCMDGVCKGSNPCDGVVCVNSDNNDPSSCYLSVGRCNTTSSLCEYDRKSDGTPCNDDNPDTEADICRSGVCSGTLNCPQSTPTTTDCLPSQYQTNQCKKAACSGNGCAILIQNGTTCDDENPNTENDICTSTGTCIGIDLCQLLGVCLPPSECHVSSCEYGRCVHSIVLDGTPCSLGVCEGGVCRSTLVPGDCPFGVPPSGTSCQKRCSTTTETTPCDDGNPLTTDDRCSNGFCVGVFKCTSVTCSSITQCHEQGTCNPQSGLCSTPISADGKPCDDANPNTINDKCISGSCSGQLTCLKEPSPCASPGECREVYCNDEGKCAIRNKLDYSSCRSLGFRCLKGNCVNEDKCNGVTCTASDSCHTKGVCDPLTGYCTDPLAVEGTPCFVDTNGTSYWSTCSGLGICIKKANCTGDNSPGGCHTSSQCKTATCSPDGNCLIVHQNNFTKCNDFNPETINDVCVNGICSGTDLCKGNTCNVNSELQCMSSSTTCDRNTGMCIQSEPLLDGTTCTDYNVDTVLDSCQAGGCVGFLSCSGVTCIPKNQFCYIPRCSPDGECIQTISPNGTPCDDYNYLTVSDSCLNGICVGINRCENTTCLLPTGTNSTCFESSTCDYRTGKCISIPKADTTPCQLLGSIEPGMCVGGICSPLLRCESTLRTKPIICSESSVVSSERECTINICPGIDSQRCLQRQQVDGVICILRDTTTNSNTKFGICKSGFCVTSDNPDRTCSSGDCQTLGDQCRAGYCDEGTGTCQLRNINHHQPCDDGRPETTSDSCVGDGSCQGVVVCNGIPCQTGSQCTTISCINGKCTTDNKPSGTQCTDNLSATTRDTCDGNGNCVGIHICDSLNCGSYPLKSCNAAPYCDIATRQCLYTPLTDYTSCGVNSTGLCLGGTCVENVSGDCGVFEACSPRNAQCEIATCINGGCVYQNKPNGTHCNDNNPNTVFDYCFEGECTGTDRCQNVTCPDKPCQINNLCEPQTGTCHYHAVSDGSPCDNDIDIGVFKCFTGVCVDHRLVTPECGNQGQCPPPKDARCQESICSTNGSCILNNHFDGKQCDDLNHLTVNDICVSGVCIGTVLCKDQFCDDGNLGGTNNPCNTPSLCDYSTGNCIPSCNAGWLQCLDAANGTQCNDNNTLTVNDICITGSCIGTNLCEDITCASPTDLSCTAEVQCNQLSGICEPITQPDLTPCSDGSDLTTLDSCIAGSCVGKVPCGGTYCEQSRLHCVVAVCNPNNTCSEVPSKNGIWCDDQNPLTINDTCNNGFCAGLSLCEGNCKLNHHQLLHQECYDDTLRCVPESGECLVVPKPYHVLCDDGNPFTNNDTCAMGTCLGVIQCSDKECVSHDPCKMAICNTTCTIINRYDGYPCDDNDKTTSSDICISGTCVGRDLCRDTNCAAELSDRPCLQFGFCDPISGECRANQQRNGTSCVNDVTGRIGRCFSGECKPDVMCDSSMVLCPSESVDLPSCWEYTCSSTVTSVCELVPSTDGSYCGDTGTCRNGVCVENNPTTTQSRYTTSNHNENPCVTETCDMIIGSCSTIIHQNGTRCTTSSQQPGVCHRGTCIIDTTCGSEFSCYNLYTKGVLGSDLADCFEFVCTNSQTSGACVRTTVPYGTRCGRHGECINGVCVQREGLTSCEQSCFASYPSALDCISDETHLLGPLQKPDGAICGLFSGRCHSGACVSDVTCGDYRCLPDDPQCQQAVCVSDSCRSVPLPDYTPCSDYNELTTNDRCIKGVCTGIDLCRNVICKSQSECHLDGRCDPKTGLCSSPRKPTGTPCDDEDTTTTASYCYNGQCVGEVRCGNPSVVCPPPRVSCMKVICQNDGCLTTPLSDGTPCDDRNSLSFNDSCYQGICMGSDHTCSSLSGVQTPKIQSQECQPAADQNTARCGDTICTDLNCCETCDSFNERVCKCRALTAYPEQVTCSTGGCTTTQCCSTPLAIVLVRLEVIHTVTELEGQITKQQLITDIHQQLTSLGTERYMIEDTFAINGTKGLSGSFITFNVASRVYKNGEVLKNLVEETMTGAVRKGKLLSVRNVVLVEEVPFHTSDNQNPVVLVSVTTVTESDVFTNPLRSSDLATYRHNLASALLTSESLISSFAVSGTTQSVPPQTQLTFSVTPCAFSVTEGRLYVQSQLQQVIANQSNHLGIRSYSTSGSSASRQQATLFVLFQPMTSEVLQSSGTVTPGEESEVVFKYYEGNMPLIAAYLISGSGSTIVTSCMDAVNSTEFRNSGGQGTMFYQFTVLDSAGVHGNEDSWVNFIRLTVGDNRKKLINSAHNFFISITHHETEGMSNGCSTSPCGCGQRCVPQLGATYQCECRYPHFGDAANVGAPATCTTADTTLSDLLAQESFFGRSTPAQISNFSTQLRQITRQHASNPWHGDGAWRQDVLQLATKLSFYGSNLTVENDLITSLQDVISSTITLYQECCTGVIQPSTSPTSSPTVSCCNYVTSQTDGLSVIDQASGSLIVLLRSSPTVLNSTSMILCDSNDCINTLSDAYLERQSVSATALDYVALYRQIASLKCVMGAYTDSDSVALTNNETIATIAVRPAFGNVGSIVDTEINIHNVSLGLSFLLSHSSPNQCAEMVVIPDGSVLHAKFQGSGYPHQSPLGSIISVNRLSTLTVIGVQQRGSVGQFIPLLHDTFSAITFNPLAANWQPSTGTISSVSGNQVSCQYFTADQHQQYRRVSILSTNESGLYAMSGFQLPDDYECFPCVWLPIVWGFCLMLSFMCLKRVRRLAKKFGFPNCCSAPRESFAGLESHLWLRVFYNDDDEEETKTSRCLLLCNFITLCWCTVALVYPASEECLYGWEVDDDNVFLNGIGVGAIASVMTHFPKAVSRLCSSSWIKHIPVATVSLISVVGSGLMYHLTEDYNTDEQSDRYLATFAISLSVSILVIEPIGHQLQYFVRRYCRKGTQNKKEPSPPRSPRSPKVVNNDQFDQLPLRSYSEGSLQEMMPRLYQEPVSLSETQQVLNSGYFKERQSGNFASVLDVYGDSFRKAPTTKFDPHFSSLPAPPLPPGSGRGIPLTSLPTNPLPSRRDRGLGYEDVHRSFNQFSVDDFDLDRDFHTTGRDF